MNTKKILSNLAGMAILVGMTGAVHAAQVTNTVTFGGDVYMCPQNGTPNRVDCSEHVSTVTSMFDIRNPDLSIPMGVSSYVISLELYDDFFRLLFSQGTLRIIPNQSLRSSFKRER